jgi:hypothetical protein
MESTLRAGFAREEITPGAALSLVGYEYRFAAFGPGNDGVLDPLYARALSLQAEDCAAVLLITLDLCVIETALADRLRAVVAAAVELTAEQVHLCCSHTHSGPLARLEGAAGVSQLHGGEDTAAALEWTRTLQTVLCKVARKASGLTEPCRLAVTELLVEFGYKRRTHKDGRARVCWNVHEWTDLAPQRQPDPTVSALVVEQASGRRIVLWSAGVHPVCLGKTSNLVSADWPGAANRLLAEYLGDCEPMYVHGAAGEVHPVLATQDRPAALETVGRAVAAPLALALRGVHPAHPGRLPLSSASVRLPGEERAQIHVQRIGPATLLLLPLEWFASLAGQLRAAYDGCLLIATVSNGWEAYWPDREAFAEGGYEVDVAVGCGRTAGDGERVLEAALQCLQQVGKVTAFSD